jgi:hypothetical protein
MDRLIDDQGLIHQFAESGNVHFLEETPVDRPNPPDGAFLDEALYGARPSPEAKRLRDHDLTSDPFTRLDNPPRLREGGGERLLDEAMEAGLERFYRHRCMRLRRYNDHRGIHVATHQRVADRGKSAISGERNRIGNALERLVVKID